MDAAAERLGVSVRQVQRLARAGELQRLGANLVDAKSVLRLERTVSGHRRRAWSQTTAWAAAALLSDVEVGWMGQSQLSRLKARLRVMSAEEFAGSSRNRAVVHRFTAHRSALSRLSGQIVSSGAGGTVAGLTVSLDGGADGYVTTEDVWVLACTFHLATDGAGDVNVVLRSTDFDLDVVRSIADAGQVLAALDLSTSVDIRERTAGLRVITGALESFT